MLEISPHIPRTSGRTVGAVHVSAGQRLAALGANSPRSDALGVDNEEPVTGVCAGHGLLFVLWQVQGSNLRRLSRLIYSQIPLATRATCRGVAGATTSKTIAAD